MRSSIRLFFGALPFVLAASSVAHAQNPQNLVQSLVAQYEKLSVAQRIAFLQTIALIGVETPSTIIPPSATSAEQYSGTEVKRRAPVEDVLPRAFEGQHYPSDIKLASIPSPVTIADESEVETLVSIPALKQSSLDINKNQIKLTVKPPSQGATLDNSVFYLLLDNYNQKIADPLQKIQAHDLRNEAINFYVAQLNRQLGKCGYDVLSDQPQAKESTSALELETDLTRIVVNKTLLETAVIGEAAAKITQFVPESTQPEIRTAAHARAAQSLSGSGDKSERATELKSALSKVISQLSDQIAEKICSIRP